MMCMDLDLGLTMTTNIMTKFDINNAFFRTEKCDRWLLYFLKYKID